MWWINSLFALAPLAVLGAAVNRSTNIRACNGSSHDFKKLVVKTPGARHAFGDLAAGACTDYCDFGEAYSYAYVSLEIDGVPFVLQPIDYVGEKRLGPGHFTYVISVADLQNRTLSIRLTQD